jgi:hypothetical protein
VPLDGPLDLALVYPGQAVFVRVTVSLLRINRPFSHAIKRTCRGLFARWVPLRMH